MRASRPSSSLKTRPVSMQAWALTPIARQVQLDAILMNGTTLKIRRSLGC